MQTIIGNQCGGTTNPSAANRTLGDFFQLRIGSKGEAQISYADSTSLLNSLLGTHAMYVRQIGGTGVYAGSLAEGRLDPDQLGDRSREGRDLRGSGRDEREHAEPRHPLVEDELAER